MPGVILRRVPCFRIRPDCRVNRRHYVESLEAFRWEVSEDKLKPFAAEFEALGVKFDTTALDRKPEVACIVIQNTDKRKQAMRQT